MIFFIIQKKSKVNSYHISLLAKRRVSSFSVQSSILHFATRHSHLRAQLLWLEAQSCSPVHRAEGYTSPSPSGRGRFLTMSHFHRILLSLISRKGVVPATPRNAPALNGNAPRPNLLSIVASTPSIIQPS